MGDVLPVPSAATSFPAAPQTVLESAIALNAPGDVHEPSLTTVVTKTPVTPAAIENYRGLPAYGLVRHAADVIPHRVALIYGERSWTYEELNYDIVRCAAMFQAYDVQPGDRVGLLLPNVPEFIVAANAVWRWGGDGCPESVDGGGGD